MPLDLQITVKKSVKSAFEDLIKLSGLKQLNLELPRYPLVVQ